MSFDSTAFLKTVTNQPGVYRMYNAEQVVIYVGKAKDLKKRLSSYFRKTLDNEKTKALVSHIQHIDVTVTHTETEALSSNTTILSSICLNITFCFVTISPTPIFLSAVISTQDSLCIAALRSVKASILVLIQTLVR